MKALLIIFILPLYSYGQFVYNGVVVDNKNKGIPYVTVGLSKENIGINADKNGMFSLVSKRNIENDSLVFSCIGFKTKTVSVNRIINGDTIELEQRNTILKPIIVCNTSGRNLTSLNNVFDSHPSYLSTTGGAQVAQLFTAPVNCSKLISIKILTGVPFLNKKNSFFRIRVYNKDTVLNSPAEELSNETIEVTSTKKEITIDLDKYDIYLTNKEFFIAIEWLILPENEVMPGSSNTQYSPIINMNTVETTNPQIWVLRYNGYRWEPWNSKKSMAMTVMVKY